MSDDRIEFGGTVQELVSALDDLAFGKESGYWVEPGPYRIGGAGGDHDYHQGIYVDHENKRIFLGS